MTVQRMMLAERSRRDVVLATAEFTYEDTDSKILTLEITRLAENGRASATMMLWKPGELSRDDTKEPTVLTFGEGSTDLRSRNLTVTQGPTLEDADTPFPLNISLRVT